MCLISVPANKPTILNENGQPIWSTVGPLNEGSTLRLVCQVTGGEFFYF